jgi:uncharacterized damage-inducible protein DinB
MYRKLDDFLTDWNYESEATLKLMNNLTDESLKQKVYDGGRDLGFLTWHITETIGEMMSKTGLKLEHLKPENFDVTKAAVLKQQYKSSSDALIKEIKDNWSDSTLNEEDEMYGEKWKRGDTLKALIGHQIHHRGQMTVLMRQAGLKVTGIYGPSKEEWGVYGMEAPK